MPCAIDLKSRFYIVLLAAYGLKLEKFQSLLDVASQMFGDWEESETNLSQLAFFIDQSFRFFEENSFDAHYENGGKPEKTSEEEMLNIVGMPILDPLITIQDTNDEFDNLSHPTVRGALLENSIGFYIFAKNSPHEQS